MFALSTKYLPRITNYAQAVEYWEKAKPFGKSDEPAACRMLERYSNESRSVRRIGADILFRLYETDVVVWKSPTEVEINGYDSVSTATFANSLLPSQLSCTYRKRGEFRVGGCLVKYTEPARLVYLDGLWHVESNSIVYETQLVFDRKKCGHHTKRIKQFLKLREAHARISGWESTGWVSSDAAYVRRILDWTSPVEETWMHYGLEYLGPAAREALLRAAAVADGAVTKEPVPLGQIPKKSVFEPFRHVI